MLCITYRLGGPGLHRLQSQPGSTPTLLTDSGIAQALRARACTRSSPAFAALLTFSIGGALDGIGDLSARALFEGDGEGDDDGEDMVASPTAPPEVPPPLSATLSMLNLSLSSIRDAGLASIAVHCRGLRMLDLGGCFELTAAGIRRLSQMKSCTGQATSYGSTEAFVAWCGGWFAGRHALITSIRPPPRFTGVRDLS